MLNFGLGMGGLLFLIGLITYVLAPRVGPNPIFGVRIGYAYASREVWDKTNRFGGLLLALAGVVVAVLGMLTSLLNLSTGQGMATLTLVLFAALAGATIWMFLYARGLAQGTALARSMEPVKFRWVYVAPVLGTLALLVGLGLYVYPGLPAERLATHFNLQNQPDGWSSRDVFISTFLGMASLFSLLEILAVFLATREPLIAFGRWGEHWQLDPGRGLIYAGAAFAILNLILAAVLWDVAWFNMHGIHAFPLTLFLWLAVPLIAIFVLLFFLLARRVSD